MSGDHPERKGVSFSGQALLDSQDASAVADLKRDIRSLSQRIGMAAQTSRKRGTTDTIGGV
jgi:hypothetical protein